MLYSYNAVQTSGYSPDLDVRCQAAKKAIDAGLQSMRIDPDEFLGAYTVAVSRWALYDMDPTPEPIANPQQASDAADIHARNLSNLQEALDTAETRSRNAISQALATLVGMAYVRARIAQDSSERSDLVAHAQALRNLFVAFVPDLETRAMFMRDPAYHAISQQPKPKSLVADPLDEAMASCGKLCDTKFYMEDNTDRRRLSPWKTYRVS